MNCWILLVLLFCGGNFCGNNTNQVVSECCNNTNRRNDCNCGCSDRHDNDRNCGCQADVRPEPRFEARPFISYSGNTCGCEEARNNNDCNCCQ